MEENGFWKVCEALDSELRIKLLQYLLSVETTAFPCVNELAELFHVSSAAMSVHLKKLAMAGLVTSKRENRRVYFRAFPTTREGERVIVALRKFITSGFNAIRMHDLLVYIHALSHARRNAIVRVLYEKPGLELKELAIETDMPPTTADRLWSDLNQAHIVDLRSRVVYPSDDPEATLLGLTLGQ